MAGKREDEPSHKPRKTDERSRLEEAKQAAKEYAEQQREIVKNIRKLLY